MHTDAPHASDDGRQPRSSLLPMQGVRSRWAALGAAVAVTLGAGTIATVDAVTSSGERPVYTSITPCRLADTRPGSQVGDRGTPLGPDETHVFDGRGAVGDCGPADLPGDALALALNVTAVGPSANTFLTVWPDGQRPTASSLNPIAGQAAAPNAVTTDLSAIGEFRVFNRFGAVDVVIDVVGFYTDHDHDDRYPSKTQRVVISPAGFVPSVIYGDDNVNDVPDFSVSNIFGTHFSGGTGFNLNLSAVAPLDLPVGSRITSITYHFIDESNLLLGTIGFSVSRTSLSINSQGAVPGSFFTTPGFTAGPRSGTVEVDHVVRDDEELHLSASVKTVWPQESTKLTIKGVVVEYELP